MRGSVYVHGYRRVPAAGLPNACPRIRGMWKERDTGVGVKQKKKKKKNENKNENYKPWVH